VTYKKTFMAGGPRFFRRDLLLVVGYNSLLPSQVSNIRTQCCSGRRPRPGPASELYRLAL
jgi:hypothetical protein